MHAFALHPKTIFILCVWVLCVIIFLRAVISGKVSEKQPRRLWMIFFLCCTAFTFWGESSELALDHYFNDLPIALLIKYLCLISVAHLFHSLLNDVKPTHALLPIKWVSPIAIMTGLVGFFIYIIAKPLPVTDLRFLYIGVRDLVVMIYALVSFIPGTWSMRRDETMGIMRFKLNLIILMTICFVITAFGSIVATILMLSKIGDPVVAASAVQPFVVFGIVLFVLIMLPYRWFIRRVHLKRFYTYYQLLHLEKRVFNEIGLVSNKHIDKSLMFDSKGLELSIYRNLIAILDFYPLLSKEARTYALYEDLKLCIETTPVYDDLIEEMICL